MRLDKFLQIARLLRRRALAKEACLAGRVRVNGRTAKPGTEIKAGDVVVIDWGHRVLEIEVVRAGPASKAEASSLYRVLRDSRQDLSS
ncbi:MAG: S4 domain-containing protein [Clostridia bacterium]|nr:S4 domain-containing protein [Clostridia bacterium]MDH7572706.1 S4 domain-containing protein [Clostridia bacterium]